MKTLLYFEEMESNLSHALFKREDIDFPFEEQLIVELYSK